MENLQIGQNAPPFSISNDRKQVIHLDSLLREGDLLLTFIHGTWCPHCVQTLYLLQRTAKSFADAGIQVAAVAFDDPPALSIFRQTAPVPITFTLLADKDQSVHKSYHLEALSAYVTVDKVGIVRGVFFDGDHQSFPGRSAIIQSLSESEA